MAYTLVESALTDTARFRAAAALIQRGVDEGEIANVSWTEAKFTINRAFDRAWEKHVQPLGWDVDRLSVEKELVYALSAPQCHTVEGYRKRVATFIAKHGETTFAKAAREFLDEIAPLAAAVTSLKGKTVKRQPKGDAEPKYAPPPAASEAVRAIEKTFLDLTQDAYEELRLKTEQRIIADIDRYFELKVVVDTQDKARNFRMTPERAQFNQLYHALASILHKVFNKARDGLSPGSDAIIAEEAKREADRIRNFFVYKNLSKIASIVDGKGGFETITTASFDVSLSGLEGAFTIRFEDGAWFNFQNSVVYAVSNRGKHFVRFPLTFHDAYKADGTKIKNPSEKKMNEEFM